MIELAVMDQMWFKDPGVSHVIVLCHTDILHFILSDNDQLEESIRRKEDIVNGLSGLWVDRVSRKLFPISFTIFNIFYWATCCSVPKEDLPDDCVVQPI